MSFKFKEDQKRNLKIQDKRELITPQTKSNQQKQSMVQQDRESGSDSENHKSSDQSSNEDEEENLSEDEYIVESIRSHRGKGKQRQYLIKWKGYPDSQNTWEPLQNLSKITLMIKQYEEKIKGATSSTKEESSDSDSQSESCNLKKELSMKSVSIQQQTSSRIQSKSVQKPGEDNITHSSIKKVQKLSQKQFNRNSESPGKLKEQNKQENKDLKVIQKEAKIKKLENRNGSSQKKKESQDTADQKEGVKDHIYFLRGEGAQQHLPTLLNKRVSSSFSKSIEIYPVKKQKQDSDQFKIQNINQQQQAMSKQNIQQQVISSLQKTSLLERISSDINANNISNNDISQSCINKLIQFQQNDGSNEIFDEKIKYQNRDKNNNSNYSKYELELKETNSQQNGLEQDKLSSSIISDKKYSQYKNKTMAFENQQINNDKPASNKKNEISDKQSLRESPSLRQIVDKQIDKQLINISKSVSSKNPENKSSQEKQIMKNVLLIKRKSSKFTEDSLSSSSDNQSENEEDNLRKRNYFNSNSKNILNNTNTIQSLISPYGQKDVNLFFKGTPSQFSQYQQQNKLNLMLSGEDSKEKKDEKEEQKKKQNLLLNENKEILEILKVDSEKFRIEMRNESLMKQDDDDDDEDEYSDYDDLNPNKIFDIEKDIKKYQNKQREFISEDKRKIEYEIKKNLKQSIASKNLKYHELKSIQHFINSFQSLTILLHTQKVNKNTNNTLTQSNSTSEATQIVQSDLNQQENKVKPFKNDINSDFDLQKDVKEASQIIKNQKKQNIQILELPLNKQDSIPKEIQDVDISNHKIEVKNYQTKEIEQSDDNQILQEYDTTNLEGLKKINKVNQNYNNIDEEINVDGKEQINKQNKSQDCLNPKEIISFPKDQTFSSNFQGGIDSQLTNSLDQKKSSGKILFHHSESNKSKKIISLNSEISNSLSKDDTKPLDDSLTKQVFYEIRPPRNVSFEENTGSLKQIKIISQTQPSFQKEISIKGFTREDISQQRSPKKDKDDNSLLRQTSNPKRIEFSQTIQEVVTSQKSGIATPAPYQPKLIILKKENQNNKEGVGSKLYFSSQDLQKTSQSYDQQMTHQKSRGKGEQSSDERQNRYLDKYNSEEEQILKQNNQRRMIGQNIEKIKIERNERESPKKRNYLSRGDERRFSPEKDIRDNRKFSSTSPLENSIYSHQQQDRFKEQKPTIKTENSRERSNSYNDIRDNYVKPFSIKGKEKSPEKNSRYQNERIRNYSPSMSPPRGNQAYMKNRKDNNHQKVEHNFEKNCRQGGNSIQLAFGDSREDKNDLYRRSNNEPLRQSLNKSNLNEEKFKKTKKSPPSLPMKTLNPFMRTTEYEDEKDSFHSPSPDSHQKTKKQALTKLDETKVSDDYEDIWNDSCIEPKSQSNREESSLQQGFINSSKNNNDINFSNKQYNQQQSVSTSPFTQQKESTNFQEVPIKKGDSLKLLQTNSSSESLNQQRNSFPLQTVSSSELSKIEDSKQISSKFRDPRQKHKTGTEKIITKQFEELSLSIEELSQIGCTYHDFPEKIASHFTSNGQLFLKVIWKPRKETGIQMIPTFIDYLKVAENFPILFHKYVLANLSNSLIIN